jgi:Tol biopolymer transport system component
MRRRIFSAVGDLSRRLALSVGASLTARRLAPGFLTTICALLALATPAHAIYGPATGGLGAEIVSVDNASDEQGNGATTDADISANGEYVVFQTKATNFFEDDGETQQEREAAEPPGTLREGGIFRYDRATGQLQLVASGNLVVAEGPEAGRVLVRGAANPSVSAEGRYVAFASAQKLVPQDTNCNTDVPQGTTYCNVQVYERDMDLAPSQAGAYVLVSAQNGSEEPPVYEDSSINPPIPGGDPGAQLSPNTAISANGRYVLFRTAEVKSSLPEGSTADTEKNQLFVRDVIDKTTTLITRKKKGESEAGAPAGGAEGPATLSADGSTVAWVGSHAPEQTVFLSGEEIEPHEDPRSYYLWRRWQEPEASTRRITGIADPEDPECPPGSTIDSGDPTATGPCYGPLSSSESSGAGISSQAPGLSADGYTVAFLAGSQLRPGDTKPDSLDVFLTSMAPGVTRKAGTHELTLAVNGAQGDGNASITSLALSSDGSHIAFVSQRNAFVLSEPAATGSFSTTGEQSELDLIDLSTNTLERAVVGLEGVEPNGSTINNPTLSADGSTLAFASSASNLIFGDANGFADAFAATLQAAGGTATPPAGVNAGAGGFFLTATSSPELGVSVRRAKDGGVLLLVDTPGPGKLTADARGSIPSAASAKTAEKARVGGTIARSSKTKKAAKKKALPPALLASASVAVHAEGTTTLTLQISSKYVKDIQREGKLKANVTIDFTPTLPSESTLSDEVAATFVSSTPARKPHGKSTAKKR